MGFRNNSFAARVDDLPGIHHGHAVAMSPTIPRLCVMSKLAIRAAASAAQKSRSAPESSRQRVVGSSATSNSAPRQRHRDHHALLHAPDISTDIFDARFRRGMPRV